MAIGDAKQVPNRELVQNALDEGRLFDYALKLRTALSRAEQQFAEERESNRNNIACAEQRIGELEAEQRRNHDSIIKRVRLNNELEHRLATAEQRIGELEASDVESMNLYRNCRDRLEAKIVDLELRLAAAQQDRDEAQRALAAAIPEDMAMRNQELIIKFITAERERDKARKAHTDLCAAISRALHDPIP